MLSQLNFNPLSTRVLARKEPRMLKRQESNHTQTVHLLEADFPNHDTAHSGKGDTEDSDGDYRWQTQNVLCPQRAGDAAKCILGRTDLIFYFVWKVIGKMILPMPYVNVYNF